MRRVLAFAAVLLAPSAYAVELTPLPDLTPPPALTPIELAPFAAAQPPVAPTAPGEYTYYCPRPAGYYPSVASCDFPWQAIPVTAPAGSVVNPTPPGGATVTPTITPSAPTVTPAPPPPTH